MTSIMPYRPLALFLDSRRAVPAALSIVVSIVAARAAGHWTGHTGPTGTVVVLIMALLPAAVIAGSTGHPFGELERVAARPLVPLKLAHLGLLIGVALVAVTVRNQAPTAARDLVGMTGLALLTAAVLRAQLAWTVPLGYGVICIGVSGVTKPPLWVWPLLPSGNRSATAVAVGLLALGLTVSSGRKATVD